VSYELQTSAENTPTTAAAPISEVRAGEVIGGFVLESMIGRGGMGTVYLGRHQRLGRVAAVKVLSPDFSNDETFVSRFLHEAKVVNDVHHENIVDIYDFYETEAPRRVAYVMEYIDGPSLADVVQEARLSLHQIVQVVLQIADALAAVHEQGVVHRDLKPENILFTGPVIAGLRAIPPLKLVDFGIAKIPDAHEPTHRTGAELLGTPVYMAPEQIAGGPVSPKTDVYGVGELLFEMVMRKPLFTGSRMEVFSKKLGLDSVQVTLPDTALGFARLQPLLGSCLALQPDSRPTIADVCAELRAIDRECSREEDTIATVTVKKRAPTELHQLRELSMVSATAADRPSDLSLLGDRRFRDLSHLALGTVALVIGALGLVFARPDAVSQGAVIELKPVPAVARVIEPAAGGGTTAAGPATDEPGVDETAEGTADGAAEGAAELRRGGEVAGDPGSKPSAAEATAPPAGPVAPLRPRRDTAALRGRIEHDRTRAARPAGAPPLEADPVRLAPATDSRRLAESAGAKRAPRQRASKSANKAKKARSFASTAPLVRLDSSPRGARVIDAASGERLGVTPLFISPGRRVAVSYPGRSGAVVTVGRVASVVRLPRPGEQAEAMKKPKRRRPVKIGKPSETKPRPKDEDEKVRAVKEDSLVPW